MRLSTHIRRLRRRPSLALLGALWLLAGCNSQVQPMESREVSFQGQDFTVVSLDLHREALTLHWKNPDTNQPFGDIQSLREWGAANGKRLMFAANAGIYDQSYAPLGLYVESGKTLVPLNLFRGNPAAICPLDQWLPDETLQSIAAEQPRELRVPREPKLEIERLFEECLACALPALQFLKFRAGGFERLVRGFFRSLGFGDQRLDFLGRPP